MILIPIDKVVVENYRFYKMYIICSTIGEVEDIRIALAVDKEALY